MNSGEHPHEQRRVHQRDAHPATRRPIISRRLHPNPQIRLEQPPRQVGDQGENDQRKTGRESIAPGQPRLRPGEMNVRKESPGLAHADERKRPHRQDVECDDHELQLVGVDHRTKPTHRRVNRYYRADADDRHRHGDPHRGRQQRSGDVNLRTTPDQEDECERDSHGQPATTAHPMLDHLRLGERGQGVIPPRQQGDPRKSQKPRNGDQPDRPQPIPVEELNRIHAGPGDGHETGRDRESHRSRSQTAPRGPELRSLIAPLPMRTPPQRDRKRAVDQHRHPHSRHPGRFLRARV